MGLELFNKTSRIKELPKYNYNGKFKLGPNGTYPIKDYMIAFYKPYERIGVIIRHSQSAEEIIEKEVKQVLEEVRKEEQSVVEEPVPVVKEPSPVIIEKENPEPVVEPAPVVEEHKVEEIKADDINVDVVTTKYTEDTLNELKMDELKNILIGLGIDPQTIKYRKVEYVQAILDAQK